MESYFLDKLLLEMGADCFEVHECSDIQFLFKIRQHIGIKSKDFHDIVGLNDSYFRSFTTHLLNTLHKLTLINNLPLLPEYMVGNITLDINPYFKQGYKKNLSSNISISNLILHSKKQEHYSTIVSFELFRVPYKVYFNASQDSIGTQCILSNGKYKKAYTLLELEDYFTLRALECFVQSIDIDVQDYMINSTTIRQMSSEDILAILDVHKMQSV